MKFSALFLVPLLLCACVRSDPSPAYDPARFSCTVTLDGLVTADCVRDAALFTMTVTSPKRLAGIALSFDETGCTLWAEGTPIPLSAGVSRSLEEAVQLLSADPVSADASRISAGGTVLTYPQGQVTYSDAGLPMLAETAGGRTVEVENFVSLPSPETAGGTET